MPASTSTTSHTDRYHQRWQMTDRARADNRSDTSGLRGHLASDLTGANRGGGRQLLHGGGVSCEPLISLATEAHQAHGRERDDVRDARAVRHEGDLADVVAVAERSDRHHV